MTERREKLLVEKVIRNTDRGCHIWKGPFCAAVVWSGPTAPSTPSEGEVSSAQHCTEACALGSERHSRFPVPKQPCEYRPSRNLWKPAHKCCPGETCHRFLFISQLDDWPEVTIKVRYFMVLLVHGVLKVTPFVMLC